MGSEWKRIPVSQVATPIIGGTPRREVPIYWGGSVRWATAKDIANTKGRYIYKTVESISQKGLDGSAAKVLPKGTVVITARGTVGALAQLGTDMAFNQTCYGFIAKQDIIPDFLYYALRGALVEMRALTYGTVFETITIKTFDHWFIPFPSIPEQHAIAHILGTLDDKIELNRKMNETLEAMASAIFKSWFVDFDPVRAKAEGRDPSLPKEIAHLFPDSFEDSELGEIPKGWLVGTIGENFNLTMGQSPPGETYNEFGEGMPFFQGCTDFGFRYPRNRVFCTAPKRLANAWDTLVSVRAPVGTVNMAQDKCCIGRGVAAIRHKSGSRSYTYYFIHSIADIFNNFEAEGTVFGCINKSDFQRIKYIVPSPQLVARFEKIVFSIDQNIESKILKAQTLAATRDALLPKLLSGEIRIKPEEGFIRVETGQREQPSDAIYTIGHSNHSVQDFITLLKRHAITAIADVRSSPFSRRNPQFNQAAITAALKKVGIAYVFLGEELGGRPNDTDCYNNGAANFEKMAERPVFKRGIDRLLTGRDKYRIALLCAEKEPLDCHRTILVCHYLRRLGLPIKHILADGSIEEHHETERRLVNTFGLDNSLFDTGLSDSERIEKAYKQQASKIAYKSTGNEENHGHTK